MPVSPPADLGAHRVQLSAPTTLVVVASFVLVLVAVLAAGADPVRSAGAQPTTTATTKATTTTKAPSTSVATTAAPRTTTVPPTTAAPTTSPASTTTTAAPTGTLAPPVTTTNAPFPAAVVGPVPHIDGGPELDISDVYEAIGEDLDAPDVVVRFRAPFALPKGPYTVAVLVGDPTGARLRASLVSAGGGAKPKGTLETRQGDAWHDAGSTTVSFQPGGFAIVRVPLASAPPGGVVWAEITEGTTTPVRTTPYFSRDGIFASTTPKGALLTSRWGRVANPDGTPAPDPVELPAGPVLRVGRDLITVADDVPAPGELLGQPVKEVVDTLRIAPTFDNGAVITDFVRIGRTDGTIGLFDGFAPAPIDKSGDRSWLVAGLAANQPRAPGTVIMHRQGLADALGVSLPVGSPQSSYVAGFGLSRTFVLADGRVVTADAVIGTDAWFGLGPEPTLPTTSTVPTAPVTATTVADDALPLPLVIGVAVAIVVLLLLVVLVRRRGRRRRRRAVEADADAGDRVPWGRDDGLVTARATAEIEAVRATGAVPVVVAPVVTPTADDVAPSTTNDVVDDAAHEQAADQGAAVERADDGMAPPVSEVAEAGANDDAEVASPTEPAPAPVDPTAALAALDLQVDAFRSRLDDLDAPAGAAPEDVPDAPS